MSASLVRLTGINSALALKAPVRCATTGPITLSGLQTIDGVTFQQSDVAFPNSGTNVRVLVKNQTDLTQNGIYVVNTAAWTRAPDFDGNDDCVQGTQVQVVQGTTNIGTWVLLTPDPVFITNSGQGVSSITFAPRNVVITALGTISSVAGVTQVIGTPGNVNQVVTTRAYASDGDGGGGNFVWSSANHSTDVTNDPSRGVFIPSVADMSGATGAWVRQYSGDISAAWFGGLTKGLSDATTKTNNTTTLQAAIDWAYNASVKKITLPAGVCYYNPGIYLDAPGNLRSSLANPTIFSFSLWLEGAGHDAVNMFGSELRFTDTTQPAIIVGTGQQMRVSDLSVHGNLSPTSRAALSTGGIGLALAGGSGGLSACLIDNVAIHGFYAGVKSGFNRDTLCDSVTLLKCTITQCFHGWHISQSQNFIDAAISCHMADNTFHILSDVGKAVTVIGGNYSGTNSNHNAFAISGTSGLSSFSDNYLSIILTNWTFTTTLSSPDQPMADGAYTAFVLKTARFGLVPLTLTAYNPSTHVATFKLAPAWLISFTAGVIDPATSDLTNELQGASTLYAAEKVTVFSGNGMNVRGVHVENPGVVTTLGEAAAGFGGVVWSRYDEIVLNYTQSQQDQFTNGVTPAKDAIFYCQTMTPFFRAVQGDIKLSGIGGASSPSPTIEGPLIEIEDKYQLDVERIDLRNPRFWLLETGSAGINSQIFGCGKWIDTSPFQPPVSNPGQTSQWPLPVSTPFQGWRPARYAIPRLTLDLLAAMEPTPGVLGNYPPIYGDIAYSVQQGSAAVAGEAVLSAAGPTATYMVRSAHDQFSYGQNLTVNWSYKGQTNVLTVDAMTWLFPGLKITLNNVDGDIPYVVTGVLPTLGYVTVRRFQFGSGATLLDGDKATIFSGATIKQAAFSFSRIGTLPMAKFTTNTGAGAINAASGDLTGAQFVNLKLTLVGAANYTTRTAAQMFGDIPGAYVGMSYMLSIQNTNAGTTVLNPADASVTINGTATIAQNTSRVFYVTFPTATTCTINSLGVTATL